MEYLSRQEPGSVAVEIIGIYRAPIPKTWTSKVIAPEVKRNIY